MLDADDSEVTDVVSLEALVAERDIDRTRPVAHDDDEDQFWRTPAPTVPWSEALITNAQLQPPGRGEDVCSACRLVFWKATGSDTNCCDCVT